MIDLQQPFLYYRSELIGQAFVQKMRTIRETDTFRGSEPVRIVLEFKNTDSGVVHVEGTPEEMWGDSEKIRHQQKRYALMAEERDTFFAGFENPVKSAAFPLIAEPFKESIGSGFHAFVSCPDIQLLNTLSFVPVAVSEKLISILQKFGILT